MTNPRQVEMARKINEMFHLACQWLKDVGITPQNWTKDMKPIGVAIFLSKYGLKHSASSYASRRYYESLRDNKFFIEAEPKGNYNPKRLKGFYVDKTSYALWFRNPKVKVQDLV